MGFSPSGLGSFEVDFHFFTKSRSSGSFHAFHRCCFLAGVVFGLGPVFVVSISGADKFMRCDYEVKKN